MRPPIGVVLVVFGLACGPSKQEQLRQEYASLYRSARAIDDATTHDVTFPQFKGLVDAMSKELLVAKDGATTDQERALVAAYEDLLTAWRDSAALWERRIGSAEYAWAKGRIVYEAELEPMLKKYHLQGKDLELGPQPVMALDPDAVQQVWKIAGEKSKKAVALYMGQ